MDDRELDARLSKIEKALDILLKLEDIHWNPQTLSYHQEEPPEDEGKKIAPKEVELE